ncbi:putative membrane protein YqjE [Natronobacillus azotifigens]|uniref:Uncharacterized protein n=1 Tax=Natronobacillus azotifigens TaxID=472978 RepID=A0A9J6RG61_9BACI|nr:hypothetical protein [Natronobacillus azotifigens]MCZ0704323.1 hypothetical protein [Natronobacillus azotifigens]
MNDFITLKILDRFAGLFRLLSVDYRAMRLILSFKLTMDKRRVPTIMQGDKQKENPMLSAFVKSLLLYAFYGLFLIPFLVIGDNYLFQMSIVFAIIMFILMTSMISDFSAVLLDVRDKAILDTKPVTARTISVAKFVHVVIYMTQLTGAFLLIPFLIGSAVNGVRFSILFFFTIIFVSLFIIVLTALFYMFILRFFDGERLRDIINYIQIFLSVGIIVGYQVLVRTFEFVDYSFTLDFYWWHYLLPPMWFSGSFEWLLLGNSETYIVIFSLLALFIPIFSIVLYIYLVPTFERNLQKLLANSKAKKPKRARVQQWIARIATASVEEESMFRFASKMLRNERDFKLKVYPSLGLSLVFPFIMIFSMRVPDQTPNYTYSYLFAYFVVLMIPTVVHMLKYSNKYKGAWLYRILPVQDQMLFYRATLKAFLIQIFLPITLLIGVIFSVIAGFDQVIHFIVITLTGWLFTIVCYRLLNNQRYPFASNFSFAQSANSAYMFLTMFLVGFLAFLHFLIQLIPYGIYGFVIILIVINIFTWKKILPKKV